MGLTHVDVAVMQLTGENGRYESQFLVDSGATETMAPASELVRVGIAPAGKRTYELADGTRVEYSYGFARMKLLDTETVGHVIFGPEGTEPLLGVTVLEALGFVIDPLSQSLKRLPAIPLK
jgi:clan AA aspartic protease